MARPKPIGFGSAILQVVDAETAPLRVFFGEMPTQMVPHMYEQRLATWAEWARSLAKQRASSPPWR